MPRTKISEYSTTNSDNTDIESININEGCAPSGINNAIRELMVHLKEFQTGSSGDPLTVAGTFVASGGATIAASAGTSASPSIHFSGDTNTGIFSPAADTIAFAEGGVEAMRINSSGNVGIGTNSPSYLLHLAASSTTDGPQIRLQNTNTAIGTGGTAGVIDFYVNDSSTGGTGISGFIKNVFENAGVQSALIFGTRETGDAVERMRIDSSGNVGIGTSSPTQKLDISSSGDPTSATGTSSIRLSNTVSGRLGVIGVDDSQNLIIWDSTSSPTTGNGAIKFLNGGGTGTERMRITSAGEVLVGGTTEILSAAGLTVQNSAVAANLSAKINLYRNDTSILSTNALGEIRFYGNDTTSNTPTQVAYINAVASGDHAAGDNPTDLVFGCTNDGSETVDEFARLGQDGASGRYFRVNQGTLANAAVSAVSAGAGTAGTLNRYFQGGVHKHSGITNSCAYIRLDAEDAAINYLWADNSDILRISTTQAHIGTTSGTVVGAQTSDERIKNILGPVTYGLAEVLSIEPVKYALKSDPDQTPKLGFIAQQVNPIVPESVFDTDEVIVEGEPTKLGMEYVALIPVLVNAVKELSAKNDALEARIAALESA